MCIDCVLASPRIAQVDPGDEPLPEVVLSQWATVAMGCSEAQRTSEFFKFPLDLFKSN
jgi:hypothetical protein